MISRSLKIGVTGGQGVGKSTFCASLAKALSLRTLEPVTILPSIGEGLKRQGIPYGSAASAESILAIYAAHLERMRRSSNGGIEILDRCAVDALCYTRALALNSTVEVSLLTELSHLMAGQLDLVVHLRMEGIFENSAATHETDELRRGVADQFGQALIDLKRPFHSIYAADDAQLSEVVATVLAL